MKLLRILVAAIALTVALANPMSALAGGWQLAVFLDGQWYNLGVPTTQEACQRGLEAVQAGGNPAFCYIVD